jgi:RNA ligase (TIGR02306 family)
VLYFPLDSVLPPDLAEKLGVAGKLAGKNHDRVRTVRLRGEISQGLVGPASLAEGLDKNNLTAELGVTKYDPPPIMSGQVELRPLPAGMSVYDLEGAERFPEILDTLLPLPVHVSEKLEGTNFSVHHDLNTGETSINQRNHRIEISKGGRATDNPYHRLALENDLPEKLAALLADPLPCLGAQPRQMVLYAELIGPKVQGNHYKLDQQAIHAFDVQVNGRWLDPADFAQVARHLNLPTAPTLAEDVPLIDWLAGRTLAEAANGQSRLNPAALREGIVVKPTQGQNVPGFGRLVLKQRDPVYLAKTGN